MAITFLQRIKATIKLMRPFQYYKNFLVFFGIVFSKQWSFEYFLSVILGFIALCAISSVNYIINDLKDIEKDRLHPEKRNRPLASGTIPQTFAILLAIALILLASVLVLFMPLRLLNRVEFAIILLVIFTTSQLYTLLFKQIVYADVVFISINYVWRAISGCVIIQASISPWLILLCLLFALLLSLSKRKGDLLLMEGDSVNIQKYRKVLQEYNLTIINQALAMVAAAMLVSYSLFTFEAESIVGTVAKPVTNPVINQYFAMLTIPLVTFALFRYLYLLDKGDKIGRKAELIFLDKQLVIAGFLAGLLLMTAIYFDVSGFLGILADFVNSFDP